MASTASMASTTGTARAARAAGVAVMALVAMWATPAAGQDWAVEEEACDRSGGWGDDRDRWCEVRTVTVAATGRLDVDGGPNGGIEVIGWDRDAVEIVAHVWGHARDDDAARELAREVRLTARDGRVRSDGPRTGRREGWGVRYEIRAPRSTHLELSTTNGGIEIADVRADVDLRTTNGGVRLEGVDGDVRGHTTNGGLHVLLEGVRWEGAGLDLTTTNGGVVLEIPDGYSAELETGTTNGSVDLDFPVTVRGRIGRTLRTTLGDGGPEIRVRTTNGSVKLRRR